MIAQRGIRTNRKLENFRLRLEASFRRAPRVASTYDWEGSGDVPSAASLLDVWQDVRGKLCRRRVLRAFAFLVRRVSDRLLRGCRGEKPLNERVHTRTRILFIAVVLCLGSRLYDCLVVNQL